MRRLLKYFIVFVVVIVALALALTQVHAVSSWSFSDIFYGVYRKVDYVEIAGNNLVSTDEITSVLYSVDENDKFILKGKKDIAREVGNIGVVREVMLKYSLPSKLYIAVKERTPIMFYHTEYLEPMIVDSNYDEFFDKRVNLQNLVYIRGEYHKEEVKKFFALLEKFPYIYHNLTEVENFFNYRFNIVLNNKLYVLLPEKNTEVALKRLQEYIVKYNLLRTNVYKIDLRSENKVFFSVSKNVMQYAPEKNRYVMYRVQTRSEKYREIIQNAISKV